MILESDRGQVGAGDLVFRTGGVERARIAHDGTGTGWSNVLGGSIAATAGPLSLTAQLALATLGSELLTNGSVTGSATGWTLTGATYNTNAIRFASNADSASQAITVVSGTTYVFSVDLSTWPGSGDDIFTVAIGDQSATFSAGGDTACVITADQTGSVTFSVTATTITTTYSLDNFSVKAITASSVPAARFYDGAAVEQGSLRFDSLNNVALGTNALLNNAQAYSLVAVGYQAMKAIGHGHGNVAVGYQAMTAAKVVEFSTAVGSGAMAALTYGFDNTAIGQGSMGAATNCYQNTAVGTLSLAALTTGNKNTAVGNNALAATTTASNGTAVGAGALAANTTGANNTAVGEAALNVNTTGATNTAVGVSSLSKNTTGGNNVAVGNGSLGANTTASNNTALGQAALTANTTGTQNTAVGTNALQAVTTNSKNTAVGQAALTAVTGSQNVGVGQASLLSATSGSNNVAVGFKAGVTGTTANATVAASGVTFVGALSGPGSTGDPSYATAIGYATTCIGNGSVAIGTDSGGAGAAASTANYFVLGTANHKLFMPGLPTADPHVAGQLWASSGVVTVSAG